MSALEILSEVHSIIRWIAVGVAVVALLRFLIGWLSNTDYGALDRGLMSAYAGFLDLNVTLGIILLLWLGFSTSQWPRYRLEHAGTMIVALILVHATSRWRKTGASATRHRNSFLTVTVATLLIWVGVTSVGGW